MNLSKPSACEREVRVIQAARTGFWEAELEQHAANCPACAEAAFAARALKEVRAADQAAARIPDAGLMWWKAQLLAKREAGEHATQPIHLVERFAYALAAVCFAGVCVWQWSALRSWLVSLERGGSSTGLGSLANLASHSAQLLNPAALGSSVFSGGSVLAMAGGVALLLMFVLFAVCVTHSEE